MTDSTRASVVIVTYNSAGCLAECLGAVNEFFDFTCDELIVVDNNSVDDTIAIASRVCPEVVVIANGKNVGFACAANTGIRASHGDYVVLVNPDVSSIEGSRTCIDDLVNDPLVAAVAVALVDDRDAATTACRTTPTPFTIVSEDLALHARFPSSAAFGRHRLRGWQRDDQRQVDEACGAFLTLTRRALDRIGGFDERYFLYYEETDWLRRAKEAGLCAVFTPGVRAVHSAGRSSGDAGGNTLELLLTESMYAYIRKWYGRAVELGMRVFFVLLDGSRTAWAWFRGPAARNRARIARSRLIVHLGRSVPRGK